MSYSDVLLFDPGASQWRCGRAEEEGPDVILPGVPDGDHEAWQRQVRAGIEALEAEPTECAMIMSEPPATTPAQRGERADFLFGLGLRSVHFAAGLVLAMYDVSLDTGMRSRARARTQTPALTLALALTLPTCAWAQA